MAIQRVKQGVKYDTCDNYAYEGNEIFKHFLGKKYTYTVPEDRHCVYDIALEAKGKRYYIEIKLKFSKVFYDNYTFITTKKIGEINEFMKLHPNDEFLYFNYYPMLGKTVLIDVTEPREYKTTWVYNMNSTADNPDIEPYDMWVEMALLPMNDPSTCRIYNYCSPIAVMFNNEIYQYGKKICS